MKTYISVLTLSVALVACGGGGGGSSKPPQQNIVPPNSSVNAQSSVEINSVSSISSSTLATSVSSTASENNSSVVQSENSSSVSSFNASNSSTSAITISCTNFNVREVDQSSVVINTNTHFSAYGVLDLQLSSEVDEDSMVVCLKDLREVATETDSLESTTITDKGNNLYQVKLSRYQLPVEYELVVYHGDPVVQTILTLQPDTKSRVAFVSKTKSTGDLASWTENPDDTPLEAADAVCTNEAHAAGLAGNYKAFLSTSETDAICRLRGGEGKLEDGCGLSSPISAEQLTAPYLNMKGLPIVYGTADVELGLWRLPLVYQANMKASDFGVAAWTGSTIAGASAGYSCDGWSSATDGSSGSATANPGMRSPNQRYALFCNDENALLCFSESTGHALSDLHERTGKLAYLLKLPLTTYVDIDLADEACREASGKDNVIAWYSDEQDDALCRLAGLSGKVASNCGGNGISNAVGPWVRADGYLLAEAVSDLSKGPMAPLNLDKDGKYSAPGNRIEVVRTDTLDNGSRGNAMTPCVSGDRLSVSSGWTYYSGSCHTIGSYQPFVYCFEQ